MAVACTTTGAATGCSYDPCSNFSVALTLPAGTNLLVAFGLIRDGRYCAHTGVTYNSAALTSKSLQGSGVLGGEVGLWYMKNPPTGSSYNLTIASGSCAGQFLCGSGFSGVNTGGDPFRDLQYSVGCCNNSISKDLTSVAGDMCILGIGWATTYSWGASQTGLAGWADNNTDGTATGGVASYKAAGSGATTTMSASAGGTNWMYGMAATIKAPSAGNQVIWWQFRNWQNFLDDLRNRLIPPQDFRRRYKEALVTI